MIMELWVNVSAVDDSYANHPENYIKFQDDVDYLIFSAGDANVADGQAIPTSAQLNNASTPIPGAGNTEIAKVFLADVSAGILREIDLASGNNRYVFCVHIDGATTTEPLFEFWDDGDYDSSDLHILGNGTPNNSLVKGVVTTSGLPGVDWVGKPLAEDADANRLLLNGGSGALTVAKDLYFNLKAFIASTLDPNTEIPKLRLYTYST